MIIQRRHTMAEGCCSAIEPCSHQQRNPTTICETCQKAADLVRDRDASGALLLQDCK